MKYKLVSHKILAVVSHPARGAWIEISVMHPSSSIRESHPARGAWIEIINSGISCRCIGSHPARGAWIEIARRRALYTS